jgi:hypothetical protein
MSLRHTLSDKVPFSSSKTEALSLPCQRVPVQLASRIRVSAAIHRDHNSLGSCSTPALRVWYIRCTARPEFGDLSRDDHETNPLFIGSLRRVQAIEPSLLLPAPRFAPRSLRSDIDLETTHTMGDNKAVQLSSFDAANPTSTLTVASAPRPTPGEVRSRSQLLPPLPATFAWLLRPLRRPGTGLSVCLLAHSTQPCYVLSGHSTAAAAAAAAHLCCYRARSWSG